MEENTIEQMTKREISTTTRWGIGIMLALTVQTASIVWWASGINAQVRQNESEITALRQGAAVILTREQLNDILGSRDVRLNSIEKTINEIKRDVEFIREQQYK